MEKIKPILDIIKAQKFWLFCVLTLLACAVVYQMISGKLADDEKKQTAEINKAVKQSQSLQNAGVSIKPQSENEESPVGEKAHPNLKTAEEMKKVVKTAAQATKDAWEKKFQPQGPLQVFDSALIDEPNVDFVSFLPAEAVPFEADKEGQVGEKGKFLPETVRINYRDKIRNALPTIAESIGSVWKPAFESNATMPKEIVIWQKDNQELWHNRFTNFKSAWNEDLNGSNVPYTLQVLYTTEDLWILRSVLKDVIAKTVFAKGDVYANDLATIKQIDHILIGKLAEQPEAGATGASMGGGAMSSGSGMGGMGMSNRPSSGGAASKKKVDDSVDPANGRYVDNEGNTVDSKTYRSLYGKATSSDGKKLHLKIAKRVQIRIGLQMDTREIPRLLANCANSPFPIEIRSLRVNLHKASKASGSGAATGGSAGMMSGYGSGGGAGSSAESRAGNMAAGGGSGGGAGAGMAPGGGAGDAASGLTGNNKQAMAEDDEGYVKPVEIFGYLYIYNKVDEDLFSILNEESTTP